MNNEMKISLQDAYAVETPDDSVQLYKEWADSYDEDFIAATGYVAFQRAAGFFLKQQDRPAGPVLDVGCGTGAVGSVLRDGGVAILDGIDISQEMLDEAGKKKTADGAAVYTRLIQADLTSTIAIDDNYYAGIVSAGTFTHGHLGPECLDELWRVAVPGAVCSIGVNAAHFDSQGFADKFSGDVGAGVISEPEINTIDTFTEKLENVDEYSLQTMIVVCRVL
jgi:ubiquinone/menaquinone biosynthesis C-methylase UbiE